MGRHTNLKARKMASVVKPKKKDKAKATPKKTPKAKRA